MLDRYSIEKIAEGWRAQAVQDAVRDRLASQAAGRGVSSARQVGPRLRAASRPRRTGSWAAGRRLLAIGLRVLAFHGAHPARADAARGTFSVRSE